MEPNMIDFYNETPHGVNVIDKLNEEYDELQKKYDELKKKINKFKLPFIIVNSIEEYKRYDDIISNQFEHKIRDFLHDEETGLLAVINEYDGQGCRCGPWSIHEIFENSWWKHFRRADRETCKEKIIILNNNVIELQNLINQIYDEAVLMGVDKKQIKKVINNLATNLNTELKG